MILCGCEIGRGQKRRVSLPVPGGGQIEAILFCGAYPGKTLVATAGVHGCEYNGIEALRGLSQTLDPAALHGQVVLVPLVNAVGFYAGAKQIVPSDGVNLNRAFPGSIEGTQSARLAFAIEQILYPQADLLVDLHGGDINEMATHFVYFPAKASEEVCQISRAAAKALSMPFRVCSSAKNGLYSWAAQRGVPALLLERGGRGSWSLEEVLAYQQNIFELLDHLDILPQARLHYGQKEIERSEYLESPCDGFWYPNVREGQAIAEGALIGELRDFGGTVLHRYTAVFDGVVLYYTTTLGVQADDPLIAYGQV